MLTLALDASTYAGTVAVLRDGEVVAERTTAMRGEREERLMPAVTEAIAAAGLRPRDLERVVCGAGPGSFTSLRIATAIAKGLATALDLPLLAVSSLALIVASRPLPAGCYLAVLGAMRSESFVQALEVRADGGIAALGATERVGEAAAANMADAIGGRLIGPAQMLEASPHARGVARLDAGHSLIAPVDVVAWEPRYGRAAEAQVRWEAAHGRPLPHG